MSRIHSIDGITLHLGNPDASEGEWIGQREVLKQLLACWLVVDKRDLPLTPRLVGTPGIGKTTLAISAPDNAAKTCTFISVRPTLGQKTCW